MRSMRTREMKMTLLWQNSTDLWLAGGSSVTFSMPYINAVFFLKLRNREMQFFLPFCEMRNCEWENKVEIDTTLEQKLGIRRWLINTSLAVFRQTAANDAPEEEDEFAILELSWTQRTEEFIPRLIQFFRGQSVAFSELHYMYAAFSFNWCHNHTCRDILFNEDIFFESAPSCVMREQISQPCWQAFLHLHHLIITVTTHHILSH